jgi:hypothetical protein
MRARISESWQKVVQLPEQLGGFDFFLRSNNFSRDSRKWPLPFTGGYRAGTEVFKTSAKYKSSVSVTLCNFASILARLSLLRFHPLS